ncbi:MAG: protein kinase [Xanthomonadales bacterium]|nr:protein kinase [Xanthomonadales bacterium]
MIGHGGMARVYLAEQANPLRKVVIKVVGPDDIRVSNPEIRAMLIERLHREGDIAARFQHPNLVTVFECGVIDEHYYMAMEYLSGGDLRARLNEGMTSAEAVAVTAQIASGLSEMHRLGLLHRDLKPENILLRENGTPVLVDFGIAKDRHQPSGLTDLGIRSGTPHYMSPEHLSREEMDARSDLYSLGIVFYELLTGDVPFDGNTSQAICRAHLDDPIPDLPPEHAAYEPLLNRMLAKEPADRFQTADELLAALQRSAPTEPAMALPRISQQQPDLHRRPRWKIGLGVALLLVALSVGWFMTQRPGPGEAILSKEVTAAVQESPNSVAVLPFVNMSPDPENEYFSDGISDEILNTLAQLDSLRVPARTSSFQFKGRNEDIREIGRSLKVRHVLEGSVRKAGERVRVTAQLIDVESGYHLWSETYDRELDDIFAIQDEIAQAVAVAIEPKMVGRVRPGVSAGDFEAYDHYLLGRHHFRQRNRESLERARVLFERAIEQDPKFALAHVGLAQATTLLLDSTTTYGDLPLPVVNKLAEDSLARAQELDPDLPELHASRGLLDIINGHYPSAVENLTRALELNPNNATAYMWRGTTQGFLGRFDACLSDLERALQIDPLSPAVLSNLIWANHLAGDPAVTERYIDEAMERFPDFLLAWGNAGNVRYMQGRTEEAHSFYQHAYQVSPSYRLAADMLGIIELDRGHTGSASGLLSGAAAAWPLVAQGRIGEAWDLIRETSPGDVETHSFVAAAAGEHGYVIDLFDSLNGDDPLPGSLLVASGMSNLGRLPALTVAYSLEQAGQQERAREVRRQARAVFENGWSAGTRTPGMYYVHAVLDAMEGESESALDHLDAAIDAGWNSWWYLANDPRLGAIRESERFQALVGEITPTSVKPAEQVAKRSP